MNLGSRRIRLRAVWLLILPFLFLARPTPRLMMVGAGLGLAGLAVRGWAAGCIRKDRELATGGPYAYTRNPLYLGTFLVGTGMTVAGGRWAFVVLFFLFFLVVYRRAIWSEEASLRGAFGARYELYRERVPSLLPRLRPFEPSTASPTSTPGFSLRRYLRNREWEATFGVAAGFAVLALRMLWRG